MDCRALIEFSGRNKLNSGQGCRDTIEKQNLLKREILYLMNECTVDILVLSCTIDIL